MIGLVVFGTYSLLYGTDFLREQGLLPEPKRPVHVHRPLVVRDDSVMIEERRRLAESQSQKGHAERALKLQEIEDRYPTWEQMQERLKAMQS